MSARIGGRAYVVGDGMEVGSLFAAADFPTREDGFAVIVAGNGFGGATPDRTALTRLRAAGIRIVVAESFSPGFARASRDTGEVLAVQSEYRLCDAFETGDCVEIDLRAHHLRDANGSAAYPLRRAQGPALAERGATSRRRTGTDR